MIKQTVKVVDAFGAKQVVMDGVFFNDISLTKDDGKATKRLTLNEGAYKMLVEAFNKGEAEFKGSKIKKETKVEETKTDDAPPAAKTDEGKKTDTKTKAKNAKK